MGATTNFEVGYFSVGFECSRKELVFCPSTFNRLTSVKLSMNVNFPQDALALLKKEDYEKIGREIIEAVLEKHMETI